MRDVIGQHVRLNGATKDYGRTRALDHVSLDVAPGSFTVLLGPSGSGKSTLLRAIAGIERLDGGTLHFGDRMIAGKGTHLAPEKRDLAMVFQDYALWPHLTVAGNVGYALRRLHLSRADTRARVCNVLERVGLADKATRYPQALSGGEQQRVGLARALVAQPSLLLFDEPLSNLDADLREQLRLEIATLSRSSGATSIYITHDQSEAFALADQVGVLSHGRLIQVGHPEDIHDRPVSPFVAAFTGMAGRLQGIVTGTRASEVIVTIGEKKIAARTASPLAIGAEVEVLVRPSAVTFRPEGARPDVGELDGTVVDVAYRGRGYEHVVDCPAGRLTSVFAEYAHTRGRPSRLAISPAGAIAFPTSGTEYSDPTPKDSLEGVVIAS